MPELNPHDEAVRDMVAERAAWREDAMKAKPIPAGMQHVETRDYDRRVEQMTPEQRAEAYRHDPDAYMKSVKRRLRRGG